MPSVWPAMDADYDMFARDVIRDPQTHDAVVRETGPVVYMPRYDVWATGRHDVVQRMYRDWRTFSSTRPAFQRDHEANRPKLLLNNDPPDHTRVRTVMQSTLSPSVLREMRTTFEREAELLVDEVVARGGDVDGHLDLAKEYVLRVFPDALGLPKEQRDNLVRFGLTQFNAFGPDNDLLRESLAESVDVFDWIEEKVQRDAITPTGLAAKLYLAADEGKITVEEVKLLLRSLYSAGSDTTIFAIGNVLKAMADFPEQWQALREDPSLARAAFEEGLRYDSPARYTCRTTQEAVDVDGVEVPASANILVLHMPIGRDPRRWQDPEVYDLRRDVVGKHLGFGFGIHVCVGAPLARLEATSLLGALARRVRSISLAGEPQATTNMAVHGNERLPLRLSVN